MTFHCNEQKTKLKKKIIYDYSNINQEDLKNYIKTLDFETLVSSRPLTDQADILTNILITALSTFVTTKEVTIRQHDCF